MHYTRPFQRSFPHSPLLPGILCACLSAAPGLVHAQQRVLITFTAPDGTTFIETLRFKRSVTEGQSAPRKTLFESKGHYTIRKTGNGYSVYVKPVKPVDLQVSESTGALLAGAMTNMRLRYDLDAQGNLRNIVGVEQAIAEVENMLPNKLRPVLGIAGLTPGNVRQQVAFDWHARGLFYFAQFSGRTLTLGKKLQAPDILYPSALAGLFRASGSLRMSGPVTCGKKRCIRFDSIGASKDPALGEALAQYVRSALVGVAKAYAPKDQQPTIPQMRFTDPYERVSLTRIFDPDTGLHHSYTQEHDIRATVRFEEPGDLPRPMHITVRRYYTYEYR